MQISITFGGSLVPVERAIGRKDGPVTCHFKIVFGIVYGVGSAQDDHVSNHGPVQPRIRDHQPIDAL